MTYSTVTPQEMAEIIAARKKGQRSIPSHIHPQPNALQTQCKYAEDTGKIAFLRAPCRGNKIICHKIDGHISYTKVCNKELCKFFETMKTNQ